MEIRERILHAAAQVYAETGFRGATTRRIAQEAGVNEITLFRHFGSKGALLFEAIRCAGAEIATGTLPDRPQNPRTELLEWATQHLSALREKRSLIRTCMGEVEEHPEMMPAEGSPTAQAAQALGAYLLRLRDDGMAGTDFDVMAAAAMLMGALFGDAMGRDLMPDMFCTDPHQAAAEYVDLFLRAIGATQE